MTSNELLLVSTGSEMVVRLVPMVTKLAEQVAVKWIGTAAATALLKTNGVFPVARASADYSDGSETAPRKWGAFKTVCVVPCSANSMATIALGLAPSSVHAALLGVAHLSIVPSMTAPMWRSVPVQRNRTALLALGHRVAEPVIAERPDHAGDTLIYEDVVLRAWILEPV